MATPPTKSFIRAGAFTGPKPGYAYKNGIKGVGYYRDEENTPAAPAAAPAAAAAAAPPAAPAAGGWSVTCLDGVCELTESEAAYLSTANLPTGMLPQATVRQVLDAAATVIAEHAAKIGQKDEGKVDSDVSVQPKKTKKARKAKKTKTPKGPVLFHNVDDRIRDITGKFSGTARYIGTVHTSKNEHLNWVGV